MANIGDCFTEYFTVSYEIHSGFISTFGDKHQLHTDEKYAKLRGFRSEVMHGNILNGFLSYFVGMCLPETEVMILSQEIKFQRPVYMNDQLKLEVVIHDIHESVNVMELNCKFRNLSDSKVVATAKINVGKTSII